MSMLAFFTQKLLLFFFKPKLKLEKGGFLQHLINNITVTATSLNITLYCIDHSNRKNMQVFIKNESAVCSTNLNLTHCLKLAPPAAAEFAAKMMTHLLTTSGKD